MPSEPEQILPASAFKWTNSTSRELTAWKVRQSQFAQMASGVVKAAEAGGKVIATTMQDLIFRQDELNGVISERQDFTGVAERVMVWSDATNTWVGVPAGDPALTEAQAMDKVFPVLDVAWEQSIADAHQAFEMALEGIF